jgi:predicted nucleotidyltransferase
MKVISSDSDKETAVTAVPTSGRKRIRGIHMNREELLQQIRQAVRDVEPDAEIILYGSRSRGDALAESDWDFLIIVDGHLSDERTDRIRHRLYEVEWESGEVISSIVRNREEWNSRLYQAMPFHQRVEREGIRL